MVWNFTHHDVELRDYKKSPQATDSQKNSTCKSYWAMLPHLLLFISNISSA